MLRPATDTERRQAIVALASDGLADWQRDLVLLAAPRRSLDPLRAATATRLLQGTRLWLQMWSEQHAHIRAELLEQLRRRLRNERVVLLRFVNGTTRHTTLASLPSCQRRRRSPR